MCFGPVPSFASAAVLTCVGGATLRAVRDKRGWLLASFPILFAIQQLNEGLLWLAIGRSETLAEQRILAFIFLFFALFLWPAFVPLSFFLLERDRLRRKVMACFIAIGAALGLYFLCFLLQGAFTASVSGYCIRYETDVPGSVYILDAAYVLSVVVSGFLSTHRLLVRLTAINLVICAITAYAYVHAHTSVWCFFAALWSALLYFFFKSMPVAER